MARRTHHINVKQVAFPFGQEYFPDNSQPAVEEGRGSTEGTVRPLDMRNVLPTEYGFSSFFAREDLGISVPVTTEYVFVYRDSVGNNTLVALGLFGAQFSNDGVTWITTEVTAADVLDSYTNGAFIIPSLATTVNPATTIVDNNASVSGVVGQVNAVVTRIPLPTNTAGTTHTGRPINALFASGFDLLVYPISFNLDYYQPTLYTGVSPVVGGVNTVTFTPNYTGFTIGHNYQLRTINHVGSYTIQAGDTVTQVLTALVDDYNAGNSGVSAVLQSNNDIVFTELANNSYTGLDAAHLFDNGAANAAVTSGPPLLTLTATAVEAGSITLPPAINRLSTGGAAANWLAVTVTSTIGSHSGSKYVWLYVDGVAVPMFRNGADLTYNSYRFTGLKLDAVNGSTFIIPGGQSVELKAYDPLDLDTLGTFSLDIRLVDNLTTLYPDALPSSVVSLVGSTTTGVPSPQILIPNGIFARYFKSYVRPVGATAWYDAGVSAPDSNQSLILQFLTDTTQTDISATIANIPGTGVYAGPSGTLSSIVEQLPLNIDPATNSISVSTEAVPTVLGNFPDLDSLSLHGISPDGTEEISANSTGTTLTYTLTGSASLAWLSARALVNPWSYAMVQNNLYCYRKGLGKFLTLDATSSAWVNISPSFLNLAQIAGIYAARSRLGAWDDSNALYTSSNTSVSDFTPSIASQANVSNVDAIVGRIINILPITNGYVIYATSSMVLAQYSPDNKTSVFKYTSISDKLGISSRHSVTIAEDGTHFAMTGAGLYAVTLQGVVSVSTEASSYLSSSTVAPRLGWVQDRYLSLSISPTTTISNLRYSIKSGSFAHAFSNLSVPAVDVYIANLPPITLSGNPLDLVQVSFYSGGWVTNEASNPSFIPFFLHNQLVSKIEAGLASSTPTVSWARTDTLVFRKDLLRAVVLSSASFISDYLAFATSVSDLLKSSLAVKDSYTISPPSASDVPGYVNTYSGNLTVGEVINQTVVTKTDNSSIIDNWFSFALLGQLSSMGGSVNVTPSISYTPNYTVDYQVVSTQTSQAVTPGAYIQTVVLDSHSGWALHGSTVASLTAASYGGDSAPTLAGNPGHHVYSRGGPHVSYWYVAIPNGELVSTPFTSSGSHQLPSNLIPASSQTFTITNDTLNSLTLPSMNLTAAEAASVQQARASLGLIPEPLATPVSYNATQGSTEPVTPVFNRSLILDTQLKNWGSCDGDFRNIVDYSPVNERSYNPITGTTGTKFTYDNLASTFVVENLDGSLKLATERVTAANNSFVAFGKLAFTKTGVTRLLDAEADLATNVTASLDVLDSSGTVVSSAVQSGTGSLVSNKVQAAKWFILKVFNRFNLKGLKFSGEIGGKR